MMKQILSKEKYILDYRIFFQVIHHETNTFRMQIDDLGHCSQEKQMLDYRMFF